VDQISPPFRIAIVAMLAVCALWFTVLKPKGPAEDTAPLPAAPGTTGLAKDVNAARGAAKKSDAANARLQDATGGTAATTTSAGKPVAATKPSATSATTPAAPTPDKADATKKAATSANPAAPLLTALDGKKAVVLLFWDSKGADDRAVHRAVTAMNRRHGRVVVKAVPVAQVGKFEAITSGAEVMQAPTVLVIGSDHKAHAIAGYTTTAELDQAAGDALAVGAK
jgi:hypothetical protein